MSNHTALAEEIARTVDSSLSLLPVAHPLRFLAIRTDSAALSYLKDLRRLVTIATDFIPGARQRAISDRLHNWWSLISEALAYRHFEALGVRLTRPDGSKTNPDWCGKVGEQVVWIEVYTPHEEPKPWERISDYLEERLDRTTIGTKLSLAGTLTTTETELKFDDALRTEIGRAIRRAQGMVQGKRAVFCWKMSRGTVSTRSQDLACSFDPDNDSADIHIDFFLKGHAANTASGGVDLGRRLLLEKLGQLRRNEPNILWIETAHSFDAQDVWIEAESAFHRRPELSGVVFSTFAYYNAIGDLREAIAEYSSTLIVNPTAFFPLSENVLKSFQIFRYPWGIQHTSVPR